MADPFRYRCLECDETWDRNPLWHEHNNDGKKVVRERLSQMWVREPTEPQIVIDMAKAICHSGCKGNVCTDPLFVHRPEAEAALRVVVRTMQSNGIDDLSGWLCYRLGMTPGQLSEVVEEPEND